MFGLFIQGADAAKWTSGMNEGKPEFKSMGPLAFGPDGVLFIADAKGAAITAIATGDTKPASNAKQLKVEAINQKIAALLGASADQILINDLAVNPISRNAYLAVSRGRGADAVPALIRVKADGQPEVVSLDKVKFSRADLPDPPADAMVGQGNRQSNPRLEAITDIGFLDGRLFVAGLANEEFASTLRAIPFPFKTVASGTSVEIYFTAPTGGLKRARRCAPSRLLQDRQGRPPAGGLHLHAARPVPDQRAEVRPKIKGKTIAELGNRNRPLDMIAYEKDGKTYLLMANSSRGVMKITTEQIDKAESITEPVADKKGLTYETIASWTGIDQLDRFDANQVVVLRRAEGGSLNLQSLPLP